MSANLKRGCGILLIVFVVLLSILALLPDADVDHDAGYTASELSIRETVDGSVISTSHVNPDGVITNAIDMGYATVCRMQDDDDRVVEERKEQVLPDVPHHGAGQPDRAREPAKCSRSGVALIV